MFIRELAKNFSKEDIGVIAENKEKYISFNANITSSWQGLAIKRVKKHARIFSLGL